MKHIHAISALLLLCTVTSEVHAQSSTSLAIWTFETSKPTTAGPHKAEGGLMGGVAYASTNTGGTITNPSGVGGSNESFGVAGWGLGEYYEFSVPTLGYAHISLRFDQVSSGSGPKSFDVLYSSDGSNFVNFSSYTVGGSSYSSHTVDMSALSQLDNLDRLYIRLSLNSTAAATGTGTVQGSGTSRIDDVTIRAATVIPEPSVIFNGALGFLALVMKRRR